MKEEKPSLYNDAPHSKTAVFGVLLALALILSFIESLVPFYFGVPGMKLGLCNVLVVFMLYRYGQRDALVLNVARILLAGFLFGNGFSILYSLAGGILSWACMCFAKKIKWFSIMGVSVVGGFTHNIGQLIVAALVVENYHIFFYAPMLMVCGVVTGALIGIVAGEVMRRV